MLLPLFFLLLSFDPSGSRFLDSNLTMTEQTYTTVQRRRSGAVSPPPWKPISIYTEYSDEIEKAFVYCNRKDIFCFRIGEDGLNDLKNFVTTAVDRLKEMIKVQSPGEVNVALRCKGMTGTKKIQNHDYAFFISSSTGQCGDMSLAAAGACDAEQLTVDATTLNVYHSYDKEYNSGNLKQFFGRPIAGKIAICVGAFKKRNAQVDDELWVSTIMHEMTHALVFSPNLFANFLKRNGNAFQLYNQGQIEFQHPQDEMYEIPGIVKKVERDWKTLGGMKKHPVHLVTTPEVTRQAREHFDCPTLEGGELENQGGQGSAMGHWEKRIYEDETMGATSSQNNAFSKITLALFADSGWYEVDYSKADPAAFGWKKGCKFATTSCGEWVDANSADSYPYCMADDIRCSEDHMQIEQCNAFGNAEYSDIRMTDEYTYFKLVKAPTNSQNGVPMAFADFCPYYALSRMLGTDGKERDGKCTSVVSQQSEDQKNSLQTFSNTARCFQIKKIDGTELHVKVTTSAQIGMHFVSHGCFEHKCEQGSVWMKAAKGDFIHCSKEGEEVKVNAKNDDGHTVEFTIICPRYENICGKKENGRTNGNGGQRAQVKTTTTTRKGDEGQGGRGTTTVGDEGAKTTGKRGEDGAERGVRRNSTKAPETGGEPESPDDYVFVSTNSASTVAVLSSFVVTLLL